MKVKELIAQTNWQVLTKLDLNQDINGCFVGDLLSFVMGNGEVNNVWVTIQGHINVVAVAALKEFSCVIICEKIAIPKGVIAKAEAEKVILISCELPVFDCVKKLIQLGV